MTRDQAIEQLNTLGYDVRSTSEDILVVAIPEEEPAAAATLAELRAALPGLDVDYTGHSDTWGDGECTADVQISGLSEEPLRCADYDRGAPYARQTR